MRYQNSYTHVSPIIGWLGLIVLLIILGGCPDAKKSEIQTPKPVSSEQPVSLQPASSAPVETPRPVSSEQPDVPNLDVKICDLITEAEVEAIFEQSMDPLKEAIYEQGVGSLKETVYECNTVSDEDRLFVGWLLRTRMNKTPDEAYAELAEKSKKSGRDYELTEISELGARAGIQASRGKLYIFLPQWTMEITVLPPFKGNQSNRSQVLAEKLLAHLK